MNKFDYIEEEIAVCGGLDVREMEQEKHEEKIKNLLFEVLEEIENATDLYNIIEILDSIEQGEKIRKVRKARQLVAHAYTHTSEEETETLEEVKKEVLKILTLF